jgi:DHA3 family tetracycline resistance protein-like MFS transporter
MTRTERTYYVICCLYRLSSSALGPTYALFLLARGLDLFRLNLVLAVYLITTCLFEVPTGALADVFGRKRSFVLSCVVRAAAFGMYFLSDRFEQFLVAEFIDAIGTTLATGAFDAWALDGIREEGGYRSAEHLFARANVLAQVTAIAGGLTAAQLAQRDLSWPWLMGTSGFLVSALAGALLMHERRPAAGVRRAEAFVSVGATLRDGLASVRTQPVVRGLCLLTGLMAFAALPVLHMWQPRFQALAGQGPWLLGWVWVFLNLALVAGSALIPALVRRWGRASALAFSCGWRAVTLAIAALATTFVPALMGFLLQEVAVGFQEPVQQGWMNEHATAAQRATVLSLRSMAFTLGGATGLACLGWVARETSIAHAWFISACLFAVAVPGYLALGRVGRRTQAGVVQELRASV